MYPILAHMTPEIEVHDAVMIVVALFVGYVVGRYVHKLSKS